MHAGYELEHPIPCIGIMHMQGCLRLGKLISLTDWNDSRDSCDAQVGILSHQNYFRTLFRRLSLLYFYNIL